MCLSVTLYIAFFLSPGRGMFSVHHSVWAISIILQTLSSTFPFGRVKWLHVLLATHLHAVLLGLSSPIDITGA